MNTLIMRQRPEPCHARQLATGRLDAAVWADLCALLSDPATLQSALQRAQQGWLGRDERQAHRRDLERRQREIDRQIQRLIDAYTAEVLTLEELTIRRKLEERRAALQREAQQLVADDVRDDQLRDIAAGLEAFRARVAAGLEQADFATRRRLVELLVDRVVVDAPQVEIRYILPLTGLAQRKGLTPTLR